MEPKRFIGSDLRRLYDRIRNDLGPDAVIIRTRSLMREGASPLTEILAAEPDGPGDFPLGMQQAITGGLLSRLEAHAQSLTVGDLEDLVARDSLAREEESQVAPPPLDGEPRPDWLQGLVDNAPVGPGTDHSEANAELPSGDNHEAHTPVELSPRTASPRRIDEPGAPPVDDGIRPLEPFVRRPSTSAFLRPPHPGSPGQQPAEGAAAYLEDLVAAGLSVAAARIVFQTASWETDRARALAATIEQRHVRYPDEFQTAVITMQGPVGAGKTTALVRMALDCADAGREALLVAGDTAHVGARGQVHAYADATGLSVAEAFDPRDVARVVAKARPGTCIFVDLPAGPWQPPRGLSSEVFSYLVLPAHWQLSALANAIAPFAAASFAGCVVTFSDLATTLAPVLSTVVESRLGLAFLSSNRDVGDGIGVADPLTLASGMFTIRTGETTDGRLVASA